MDFIDDLDVSIIANILVNMGIDISNLNDITDADDYLTKESILNNSPSTFICLAGNPLFLYNIS